eukprot:Gregarina_sp_Poly_1__1070@NODE_1261_length_4583_cov_29_317095_g856_i0_p3_GENE_NODE_1261_length_4583_cov_29_317095_g856_i0NODE_1261_length_4583_cov_29_317095_g856_i0_p3_ORF_typecomplete_len265_score27_94Orn_Arg_deC_N/PF02784_16/2_5e25Orn_DAP_Arg_deC/PF00278_22/1_4e18Ala_racemase_N/PF01168_20/0_036_NODE_1261_length_4583_cov_29_317095_g856_i017882582
MCEVNKLIESAPGARVMCRLSCASLNAGLTMGHKFGCSSKEAVDLLKHAHKHGLQPLGLSFHVGSQQKCLTAWKAPITNAAGVFRKCEESGFSLSLLNLGGGFPAAHAAPTPEKKEYGRMIYMFIREAFGPDKVPKTMIEPGRGLIADAGRLHSEIVLIVWRNGVRWIYLDAGRFNGLSYPSETEAGFRITTAKDADSNREPSTLAGLCCTPDDMMLHSYDLPSSLAVGDRITFQPAGAYTVPFSTVCFNGFPPLQEIVIRGSV